MKKNTLRFMLATVIVSALALTSFLTFKPATEVELAAKHGVLAAKSSPNACPAMCSSILTDCYGGSGCTLPGCTSDWKVPNLTPDTYTPVNYVTITFSVCYVPTGTPTWTSYNKIGKMMNSWFVPPATQTFNCTASNGSIFKCTVYTNGDFYMQHFSGPVPTGGGLTMTGTYGIKCGSPCNS